MAVAQCLNHAADAEPAPARCLAAALTRRAQDTADSSYTWTEVTVTNEAGNGQGPTAIHSAACAAIGTSIYVAAGNLGYTAYGSFGLNSALKDDRINVIFRLETTTNTWTTVRPPARCLPVHPPAQMLLLLVVHRP